MKRRIRVLAILALIAASGVMSPAVFANCLDLGVYEILQCGTSTWFAPTPAGAGHVSGAWWGVGFGNRTEVQTATLSAPGGSAWINPTPTTTNGTFIGVDSGTLPALVSDAVVSLDLTNATLLPINAPAGSLCFSARANWGSPGIDSCIDINRTDQATGGLVDSPGQSDNYVNKYWDTVADPNGYVYYNHQLDPPLGVLLTEGTGRYFAAAFFASSVKDSPKQGSFDTGNFNMGAITNGDPNPNGGNNNVVPWQAVPDPVPGVVILDPNDINSVRNVTLDWSATAPRFIHDNSTRPCWSDSPVNSVPCSTLGTATGVGVLDQGALIRYEMESTTMDASKNCGTTWTAVPGTAVDYPATSTVGNGVAPNSCVRLKISFGKAPGASMINSPVSLSNKTTNANNAQRGLLGDQGYFVVSENVRIGGALVSQKATLKLAERDRGTNLHLVFDTDTELNVTGFDVVGIDGKGGRKVIGSVACKQCTSGLSASYDQVLSGAKLQGAKKVQIVIQPAGTPSNTLDVK